MALEIFLTGLLVVLNGFFVAAEFALVKIRLSQIEMRIQNGSRVAVVAKSIVENLDAYLSASQLGITLASLALGWIGEDVVAKIILHTLDALGLGAVVSPSLAHSIAIPIAFVVITVLHIILGEQAPKWLAIQRPEPVTLAVALPLRLFYTVFKPFIIALNWLANWLLRLVGINASSEHEAHTVEELRYLIEQGAESGTIESREHELIENVFALGHRTARQIMVPRRGVHAIDITTPIEELLERVIEDGYSRLPVYHDTLDNIVGVVYAKDILTMARHQELIILQDIVRPPYFVSEEKNVSDLLKEFQKRRIHVAIVVDEFGGTSGMVTLEDILEEIVGDIMDEYDEDVQQIQYATRDEFVVNAQTSIVELNALLPEPLPEDDRFETLAGLLNATLGRIPRVGDEVEYAGYACSVLEATRRTAELVRVKKQAAETSGASDMSGASGVPDAPEAALEAVL
jgi:CBS domain containing-hemolysin-like protein